MVVRVGTAQKSKFIEVLPLAVLLAVMGVLLYVFINCIGPEWLRLIIVFLLVGAVLVITGIGLRGHLRDINTEHTSKCEVEIK